MFDIGFLELLIIGVVGLLVLGPERLPKAARTTGLWIGKIKRSVSGMQREISAQLEAEELRQKLTEQQKKLDAGLDKARRDVESYAESPTVKEGNETSSTERPLPTNGTAGSSNTGISHAKPAEHEPVETSTSSAKAAPADDKDSSLR